MNLRLIWRMTSMDVMATLEYRGAFFIYMVNTVAVPLISLLVWRTVSRSGAHLPYSQSQLVTYYVLLSGASMLTSTWMAAFIADWIRLGNLSPWLLRPVPFVLSQIGNNIGEKIVKMPLLLPLAAGVALLFHSDLSLPSDPLAWARFGLCLPLAAIVAFQIDFLTGLLAFWIQDVRGFIRFKELTAGFLSGQFIPLALFPPAFGGFLQVQPFRYTLSFPLEVLLGRLSGTALAEGFALQCGYCVLFWVLYRLLWRSGLRAYSAVGA